MIQPVQGASNNNRYANFDDFRSETETPINPPPAPEPDPTAVPGERLQALDANRRAEVLGTVEQAPVEVAQAGSLDAAHDGIQRIAGWVGQAMPDAITYTNTLMSTGPVSHGISFNAFTGTVTKSTTFKGVPDNNSQLTALSGGNPWYPTHSINISGPARGDNSVGVTTSFDIGKGADKG